MLFTNDGKEQTITERGRNMLMLMEYSLGVCWMQPDEATTQDDAGWGVGSRSGSVSVGSNHTGVANFGLLDGDVTFISKTIHVDVLDELVKGTAKERP